MAWNDGAPHRGNSTRQRGMGGEVATSVAAGTSILPVQELEDKKNLQKRHSRCVLLIPGTWALRYFVTFP